MSDKIAVEFAGVGKLYKLYKNRTDSFLDITGLGQHMSWHKPRIDKFWALRDISFRLKEGSRLGIVGRNGAGKSTLLKLMTGNVVPTEGKVTVNGEVQALLQAGAGFHPDFTGYENVEASLIQSGLEYKDIKLAIEEIAEFTELGEYMGQPFKSYSAGMQARLVFATATTVKPEILIIDEILGAGDAYFAVKSRSRMKKLVDSGASIFLVSHDLSQVMQFCDESIWIERGRIVMRGATLEVVKAYQEFIHEMQDRQLKSTNRRRSYGFRDAVEVGHFAETFVIALSCIVVGADAQLDVSRVEFRSGGTPEMTLRVGDMQDLDETQTAHVSMATSKWGDPQEELGETYRSIPFGVPGELVMRSFALETGKPYSVRFRYRLRGSGKIILSVSRNGEFIVREQEIVGSATWQDHDVDFVGSNAKAADAARIFGADKAGAEPDLPTTQARPPLAIRRWPGEGSLLVAGVSFLNSEGQEQAVFKVGSPLTVRSEIRAERSGEYPLVIGIVIAALDGTIVTQNVSGIKVHQVAAGDVILSNLKFESMNLANGRYVVTVSLHKELDADAPNPDARYDLVAQSYQFEIVGNPPLRLSLYQLPASWHLERVN